jgi:hypothetical protein
MSNWKTRKKNRHQDERLDALEAGGGGGTDLTVVNSRLSTLESTDTNHGSRLTTLESTDANHGSRLSALEGHSGLIEYPPHIVGSGRYLTSVMDTIGSGTGVSAGLGASTGQMYFFPFSTRISANIDRISVRITATTTGAVDIKFAIYESNAAGEPSGFLVSETSINIPISTPAGEFTLSSATFSLVKNKLYWFGTRGSINTGYAVMGMSAPHQRPAAWDPSLSTLLPANRLQYAHAFATAMPTTPTVTWQSGTVVVPCIFFRIA